MRPYITAIKVHANTRRQKHQAVVDLVQYDGANNVQLSGRILARHHPRITVCHGAEHAISLFFKDVFELVTSSLFFFLFTLIILLTHSIPNSQLQIKEYKDLSNFCKGCRNIFGSVRHGPHAMFKHYTQIHNNGIFLGLTKPSECRMAGEKIALTCLLCPRYALKSAINSKEFMDLNNFKPETFVLNSNNF